MTDGMVEPLYFGDPKAPNFGWWHRPAAPMRDTGIVLCAPFGREEVCAYRSLRELASRLATAGLPVLRFDYPGCGDSAGDGDAQDVVQAWTDSVGAAADEIKHLTGVSKVAIAGLRLGAALGFVAALERDDVSAFLAIAPVLSGRGFVRELKALQAANVSVTGDSNAGAALESGGYALSATTLERLGAIDLRVPAHAPAAHMLVIDRDDLPGQDQWVARLAQLGSDVLHSRLPGYADMMQDPHNTRIPQAMISLATDWLTRISSPFADALKSNHPLPPQIANLGGLTEQPVWVGSRNSRMSGVLSLPADVPVPHDAVLLLNAGATRRTGPSRMYVTLARDLARQGMAVLRLDISGIGDSPPRAGTLGNVVYSPTAVEEVASAVTYLKASLGVERCQAVGMCSGAYHAFKAAVRETALAGIVAINPLTFFWHDGDASDVGAQDHEIVGEVTRQRANLFVWARWRKLLRGQVDVRALGRLLWRSLRKIVEGGMTDLARLLRVPLKEDLARELRMLVAHRTSTHFLFSEGDPGERLLHLQGGRGVARMLRQGHIEIHVVPDGDHTFTREVPRKAALALLNKLLGHGRQEVRS